MPESENENALSRRLNKVLETRFENDQVNLNCVNNISINIKEYRCRIR